MMIKMSSGSRRRKSASAAKLPSLKTRKLFNQKIYKIAQSISKFANKHTKQALDYDEYGIFSIFPQMI